MDLTQEEKGLKFVIVRQKRQYLGLVFVSEGVDEEAVEMLQMMAYIYKHQNILTLTSFLI